MRNLANIHRWTVEEDITLISEIMIDDGKHTISRVATDLGVTAAQASARLQVLKSKGLKLERQNHTQRIVAVGMVNPKVFKPEFRNAVKVAQKVCITREAECLEQGLAKLCYKSYTLADDNTLRFFGETRSINTLAKKLGRTPKSIVARQKFLGIIK